MQNNLQAMGTQKDQKDLNEAKKDVKEPKLQNLGKENIGLEQEEKQKGDPNSPYKLKHTLDDKRPEDSSIEKGWTVDSNTSRGSEDLNE